MKLGALFTVGGGVAALYYQSHLQAAPITNRERFISLTPDQYLKIADFETNSVGIYLFPQINILVVHIRDHN